MAMRVLDPPAGPVDAFTSVVGPLLREADNLILQNGTLTRMRNLMLPKLVTGQIDVSALDFDAMVESVA
jgi:type I restriction enzyme S subunit